MFLQTIVRGNVDAIILNLVQTNLHLTDSSSSFLKGNFYPQISTNSQVSIDS